MKITLTRKDKTITFDTPDDSIEETFGFIMFGLFGVGYDFEEINKHILSVASTIIDTQKDQKDEPDQNSMPI